MDQSGYRSFTFETNKAQARQYLRHFARKTIVDYVLRTATTMSLSAAMRVVAAQASEPYGLPRELWMPFDQSIQRKHRGKKFSPESLRRWTDEIYRNFQTQLADLGRFLLRHGWSKDEVAQHLSVHRRTVLNWAKLPSDGTFFILGERETGVTAGPLYTQSEPKTIFEQAQIYRDLEFRDFIGQLLHANLVCRVPETICTPRIQEELPRYSI